MNKIYTDKSQSICLPCDRHINRMIKKLKRRTNGESLFNVCTDPTIVVCELMLILDNSAVEFHDVAILNSTKS